MSGEEAATDLCATECASDKDCGPDDGRCRIVDVNDPAKAAAMPLVDDLPPEEIAAWMKGTEASEPPMVVCDSFFEIDGAVDADLADLARPSGLELSRAPQRGTRSILRVPQDR